MKKRFPAFFLALALCLGLSAPAFAASGTNSPVFYRSAPDNSGILYESETDTYKIRSFQPSGSTMAYGETVTTGTTTVRLVPMGVDIVVEGLKPGDEVVFYAWSDPDGDGVYDSRMFMKQTGKGISVVPLPEGDSYTDLPKDSSTTFGECTSAADLGFSVTQDSVTAASDRLYELFGANTVLQVSVWLKSGGDVGLMYMLSGEPTLISSIFTDVPVGQWYTDPVTWAKEREIASGTTPTKFSPTDNCTQAQILTFLYRAARGEGAASAGDMDKAVSWAREKGMIDDTFDGSQFCTRATAVSYIWQAFGKPGAKASSFTDVDAGASYAKAVDWAVEKNVTNGTDPEGTMFSPDEICTRRDIVTFLYRAYNN